MRPKIYARPIINVSTEHELTPDDRQNGRKACYEVSKYPRFAGSHAYYFLVFEK